MIFQSSSVAKAQVAALLQKYPDLQIASKTANEIVITGWVQIARIFNDFPIIKNVQLEIIIPIAQDRFPYVRVHTAVSSGSWCGGQRQQCGDSGSGLR